MGDSGARSENFLVVRRLRRSDGSVAFNWAAEITAPMSTAEGSRRYRAHGILEADLSPSRIKVHLEVQASNRVWRPLAPTAERPDIQSLLRRVASKGAQHLAASGEDLFRVRL